MNAPFLWLEDATVSITTGNSSANVALKKMPTGKAQVRVFNAFTSTQFIRKGVDATVAAVAATDLPVAPGATEVFRIDNTSNPPITHIAMISPTGSGTLYVTTAPRTRHVHRRPTRRPPSPPDKGFLKWLTMLQSRPAPARPSPPTISVRFSTSA